MKILWIAGWYPHQTELYTGDFVQRHAQAVSLFHDVTVIFVTKDQTGCITKNIHTDINRDGRLKEIRVYYHSGLAKIPVIGRLFSFLRYRSLLKKQVLEYIQENGKPELIHFYIGMRTGSLGAWIRKAGIPYVISEQWTGFQQEGEPNFRDLPSFFKSRWLSLFKNAQSIHVVSNYLRAALERLTQTHFSYELIPNVVNTTVFFPGDKMPTDELRLVFVTSHLDYQKNTKDILHALGLLKQRQVRFRLDIFGPIQPFYQQLAVSLDIRDEVIFQGEQEQTVLASFFRQADGLIIYSRFENLPCVVGEAEASGIPVIASDIPVLREMIDQGVNGCFAKGEDAAALADALFRFSGSKHDFDRSKIAEHAVTKYNYKAVGKMFSEWYVHVLSGIKR